MLRYRLFFGLLMIVAALGVCWADAALAQMSVPAGWRALALGGSTWPPGLPLAALLVLVAPPASRELAAMFARISIRVDGWLVAPGAIATALFLYALTVAPAGPSAVPVLATVLIGCMVLALAMRCRHRRVEGAAAGVGATMFAVSYLGLCGGFVLCMRIEHAPWVVLAVLLTIKCSDMGAYFVGHAIGRRKLIPWLSPGKTWAGLVGAMAAAALVAAGFAAVSQQTDIGAVFVGAGEEARMTVRRYDPWWAAAGGAVLALLGHAGDLTVSLLKREAGVKDSGNLLPGFGGVLDVLDSLLLAGPGAYWMLKMAV